MILMSLPKVKFGPAGAATLTEAGKNHIGHHPVQKDVSGRRSSKAKRCIIAAVPISSTSRWVKGIISDVIEGGLPPHVRAFRDGRRPLLHPVDEGLQIAG